MISAGFETAVLALKQIQTYVSERFVPGFGIYELLGHEMYVSFSLFCMVLRTFGREATYFMTQNFILHYTNLIVITDLYLNKLSRVLLKTVLFDPLDKKITGLYGTVKLKNACPTARSLLLS
jgi:hypothetical protein